MEFRLIEGPLRENTIKKIYLQVYGIKLVGRADALVADSASFPLTTLQLKRFFAKYDSASKAKENQKELLLPETLKEKELEVTRVFTCTDTLQQALDKVLHILPHDMAIIPRLQAVKEEFMDLLAYLHFHGRSMIEHKKTLDLCRNTYACLREVASMQAAAWAIQRKYKKYRKHKNEYLARHNAAADRIYRQYLKEKNTDYVRLEWEADRRKEQEALEAAMKEEQLRQEKARVEHELRAVLPYGWERVWKESEQHNQDEGRFVYRAMDKRGKFREQEERPVYTYEQDKAVWLIQSAMRLFKAKRILGRLKRAHK